MLAIVVVACTGSSNQDPPAASSAGSGSSSLGMPLAPPDDEAFRAAEATLRRDGRAAGGLAQLGPGALDLAAFMDRAATFLLVQVPDRLKALKALVPPSGAGGRLAAPLRGLPPPGQAGIGAYLTTTQGFSELLGKDSSNNPDWNCPCSTTLSMPLATDEVTIGGNKGTVTSTMTMTGTFNGAKISVDVKVTVGGEVRDAVTGALLYKISNEATGHADGDVCPDTTGTARANLLFAGHEDYFDATGAKTGSGVSESYGGELRFRADDSAKLAGVDLAPTGKGGEFMLRLSAQSIAPKFEKAWRSGRCVVVLASPEGGDVEKDSVTTVTVKVKHKVEGNELDKPVEAKLGGPKSIDPAGTKQKAPATFRYTAGSADGDRGALTFKSTSNRGIGETEAVFHVGGAWLISLVGSSTETVAAIGLKSAVQVSFTDVSVKTGKDNTLSGSGPITIKGSFEGGLGGEVCTAPIDRTFPFTLSGTLVGTFPDAVLKLKINAATPPGETLTLTCDDVTITLPMPGEGNFYGFALGELDLPAKGGRKSFDRSAVVGGLATVRATAAVDVKDLRGKP